MVPVMQRSSLRPAQQSRSKQTEARLLRAAEEILAERGIEGAAIPDIARRARVSPASIYRRFTDKDGLLREVFERFFDRSIKANEAALDPNKWRFTKLKDSVRALVTGMVCGYGQNRGLLRAVITYGERHPSAAFRRRTAELRQRSVASIARILLLHVREIKHPHPEKAVQFGMQLIALALKEQILPVRKDETLSDKELATELSRLLLGYLQLKSPWK
jgi:AcrR family transcriptional regulator